MIKTAKELENKDVGERGKILSFLVKDDFAIAFFQCGTLQFFKVALRSPKKMVKMSLRVEDTLLLQEKIDEGLRWLREK